jgi:hypothetical protein
MDTYEKLWLEEKLSDIERKLELISIKLKGDSKYIAPSPEVVKESCLVLLETIGDRIFGLRQSMVETYQDRRTGEILHGFAARALEEWQIEADERGLHRCQRPGWKTEDGCECKFPDGTSLVHEPWGPDGAKVLNKPGSPNQESTRQRPRRR